ncbi:Trp biosynthesis-associated membrane protein [Microcella sp.]|uniref:Trp biosynthesis-associated membrane protein n=1 Tax=Microcella sp. TaxID=1913979 RepID=UPI003918FB07
MTPERRRLIAIVAPLLAAGLALLAWTQVWVVLDLGGGLAVEARGETAAATVPALALALLALTAALALVGRTPRILLAIVQLGLGVGIAAASLAVLTDPVGRGGPAVTAVTGVDGDAGIAALVAASSVTGWVSLAIVAGVLAALSGVLTAATAHRWPERVRRYDAPDGGAAPRTDRLGDWDALSDGDDPTAR